MTPALFLTALMLLAPLAAHAEDWSIDHEQVHFVALPLDRPQLDQLFSDTRQGKFPSPWSGASVKVTWTADCVVSLDAAIILPLLIPAVQVTAGEQRYFDAVVELLKEHETETLDRWRYFGQEIKAQHCPADAAKRNAYWQAQIRLHKTRTNFGMTGGIALLSPPE